MKSEQYHSIIIVVPFFNEATTIAATHKAIMAADTLGLNRSVIYVDDGSTDNGLTILKNIIKKSNNSNLEILSFPKNHGKGAALKAAFLTCNADIVLVQDADGEYSPTDYPLLLAPIMEGRADVVFGSRFFTPQPHRALYFWHYVANRVLTIFSNMFTNLNLSDMETGYKVFRGKIIGHIAPHLKSSGFGIEPELTARLAHYPKIRIYEVGVCYSGRKYEDGKKITFVDGIRAFFEIVYFNVFVRHDYVMSIDKRS